MTLDKFIVGCTMVTLTLVAAIYLPRFLNFEGGGSMDDFLAAHAEGRKIDDKVSLFRRYYDSEAEVIPPLLDGSLRLADAVETLFEPHEELVAGSDIPRPRGIDRRVHLAFGLVQLCRCKVEIASAPSERKQQTLAELENELEQLALCRNALESLRRVKQQNFEIDIPTR